jgi:DNA-binding NarL/FixJ family response regulator
MAKPLLILVVDDQPRARKSLKALLATWPQVGDIREASNGREALRWVEELQPDLVLMDVRMPGMDGLEATAQIKAQWPQLKVLLLSMYAEHRSEALAAGADAFVSKEQAPEKLLDILAGVMQRGA